MKKRLISCLLSLALLFACLPLSALAAEEALPGFARSYPYTPFSDIQVGAWYEDTVKTAVEYGIINGMGDNLYEPAGTVTLAQAIKIAACIHAIYTTGEADFPSSPEGLWYRPYVDYAAEQGIVTETYPDYNAAATRLQIAAIFTAALPQAALPARNKVVDNAIPDVPSDLAGAKAVYRLYRAGILQGMNEDHCYWPNSSVKRSEIAAIVSRLIIPSLRLSFAMGEAFEMKAPASLEGRIEKYLSVTLDWSRVAGAEGYSICISTRKDGNYTHLSSVRDPNATSWTVSVDALGTYYFKVAGYQTVNGEIVVGPYTEPMEFQVTVPGESAYAVARDQAGEQLNDLSAQWGWGGLQYAYYDMDKNGFPEMFIRNADYPDSISAIYTYRDGQAICLYIDDFSDIPGSNQYFSWDCHLLTGGVVYFEIVKDYYDKNGNLIREVIGADFNRLSADRTALVLAEAIVYDGSAASERCWQSPAVSSRNYFAGNKTGFISISENYFDSLYFDYTGYGSPVSMSGWDWTDF